MEVVGSKQRFFDVSAVDGLQQLQRQWTAIRDEFFAVGMLGDPYFEKHLHDNAWFTIRLCAPVDTFNPVSTAPEFRYQDLFPITSQALQKIPGLGRGGFSTLKAGGKIHPHVGFSNSVYRIQLVLNDAPGSFLRVEDEIRYFRAGEMFMFDDMLMHEAVNPSTVDRVSLIVDIDRAVVS